MGINASKLDEYTTPDNPFVDSKGNVITDLTACLYNYSGGYTINGPIFALIALDMGEYTIPKNAVWTREKLLETILDLSLIHISSASVGGAVPENPRS